MGKIIETKINRFDGGILKDLRENSANGFAITKHFDTFSNKHKLTPYRSYEANETKTFKLIKFLFANSNVYGFGVVVGGGVAKIYKKTGDVITGAWTEDQNVNGTGARNEKVFFHYKNYLYYWAAGTALWRHGDITGTPTNASYQSIAYTNVAQPVHHPADDCAYFFQDNIVHRIKLNGDWDATVLTLPSNLVITSATPYGNYLAIGCKSSTGVGNSIVFLWDRDSSLATISQKIDWGLGELVVLAEIDGVLYGISNVSTNSAFGIKYKIHIKAYTGTIIFIQELDTDTATTGDSAAYASGDYQVRNNKLYFAVHTGASANAKNYTGIWVIGKHEIGSPLATTLAYKIDTDASSDLIQGFFFVQDYLFVAHSSDGSVDRIDDQATYSATSIYESKIFNNEDSSQKKKLLGITVITPPLPAAGQVDLKYRKDEDLDSTWTIIFTHTTDDSISHSAINIESSGATLPEFKEIQFRIESIYGAEITGLKFRYEVLEKDLY